MKPSYEDFQNRGVKFVVRDYSDTELTVYVLNNYFTCIVTDPHEGGASNGVNLISLKAISDLSTIIKGPEPVKSALINCLNK